LAAIVAAMLGYTFVAGVGAVWLLRRPPRNIYARLAATVLLIPVIYFAARLAIVDIPIAVRVLGAAIAVTGVLAVRALIRRPA
jgi:ABC-type phosphate transport system permease subunit